MSLALSILLWEEETNLSRANSELALVVLPIHSRPSPIDGLHHVPVFARTARDGGVFWGAKVGGEAEGDAR